MSSAPSLRVIPRLDIKGPNVVKGIHFDGLRVVGDPAELALRYYEGGADELLYMDVVATLYGRNSLLDIVERAARSIFIPMTVGGGIRSVEDIRALLRAGADKVAVNTAAVKNPDFIAEAARRFGSQCIVVSIEAKRREQGRWEALTDNGRETTGLDAVAWAHKAAALGAGEILLTSVDQEGTGKGYDVELVEKLARALPVPVIAGGGAGSPAHVAEVVLKGGADAVSMAAILHYRRHTIAEIKEELAARSLPVRRAPAPAHG
jgi:cyclase